MKILGFDIETIPCRDIPEECIPSFDPETVKYGNTKDPIKRLAKEKEAKEDFEAGKDKKMSTDPALYEVCAFVGILYETEKSEVIREVAISTKDGDDNDYDTICAGWDIIRRSYNERIPLVSYNGVGFDLPVMQHRAIYNDVPFSPQMYSYLTKKWEGNKNHYDLMLILSGWNNQRWKKLDFYLKRLRLGQKTEGMDGGKVHDEWKAGNHQKILDYCRDDVLETCKLFERIEPWIAF